MHLLIRHGPKAHANNDLWAEYRLDPPLTSSGTVFTRQRMSKIVSEFGEPDMVVCSPYLRTRQTAEILVSLCTNEPGVIIEPLLSEYLGNQKGELRGCMRDETSKHNPPIEETMNQFRTRVKEYLERVSQFQGKIYLVTHGLFVAVAAELDGHAFAGGVVGLASHYQLKNLRATSRMEDEDEDERQILTYFDGSSPK